MVPTRRLPWALSSWAIRSDPRCTRSTTKAALLTWPRRGWDVAVVTCRGVMEQPGARRLLSAR